MKKSISFILAIFMLISCFGLTVFAADEKTSTDYRYERKFLASKLLYSDFALISEETCPIPGLEKTNVYGDVCTCMTPQGLCVTEDYIFISAYCNVKKYKAELEENIDYGNNAEKLAAEENHKTHNSVIYIIDRDSGEYIKNMVLSDNNHVGGLATDGKAIYVAKSTDEQVSVITMTQVEKVLAAKSLSVKIKYDYTVDCGCTASFVTFYNNTLWVGVFNEESNGTLTGFSVNKKNYKLTEKLTVEIPAKANGACFTELDGEVCLVVNTSYGRKNPSQIYLFSVADYATGDMVITEKHRCFAPPTVQNSCVYEGKIYYIYESAATCYSEVETSFDAKSTTCAVDRVCIGDVNRLFNWHCEENLFILKLTGIFNSLVELLKSFI